MSLVLMDQTRFKCFKHFKEILSLFNPSFSYTFNWNCSNKKYQSKSCDKILCLLQENMIGNTECFVYYGH